MAKNRKKDEIVTRNLADLKPHRKQAKLFDDLPEHELQQLADDIEKNGLKHPLDILPDGTVVGGHQRLRALKLLGKESASCRILYNLAEAGEEEIERYLISDNLARRQLTKLDQARLYRELKQLGRNGQGTGGDVKGDLRDHLAKTFKCSGRNLDRWEKVLDCPREVQDAVSRGELPLVAAGKVAVLPKKDREKIAKAIRGGENPKHAVHQYLNREENKPSDTWRVTSFLRSLCRIVERFGPQNGIDVSYVTEADVGELVKGQELVTRLIRDARAKLRQDKQRQKKERAAQNKMWEEFATKYDQEA